MSISSQLGVSKIGTFWDTDTFFSGHLYLREMPWAA